MKAIASGVGAAVAAAMVVAVTLTIALAVTTRDAEEPVARLPLPPGSAADRLAHAGTFSIGGIGFAGSTGEPELLTREIANQPDAIVVFARLATSDNRVARLYAYWALRSLAPEVAAVYEPSLAGDATVVGYAGGCMITSRATRDILPAIRTHRPLR